jgi:hypothetical protein
MDDCIEAQWGLYIGYMKETLDYTITIMPLTIIPLTFRSPTLAFRFFPAILIHITSLKWCKQPNDVFIICSDVVILSCV